MNLTVIRKRKTLTVKTIHYVRILLIKIRVFKKRILIRKSVTFAFWADGELPIDNNLAERCIRKLTTQRNSMLHFGSDEGVEMAATYHSIISTVKLHGKSAWNFLGTFFKKIFNGCRDFICLTPGNIEMAVCQ